MPLPKSFYFSFRFFSVTVNQAKSWLKMLAFVVEALELIGSWQRKLSKSMVYDSIREKVP